MTAATERKTVLWIWYALLLTSLTVQLSELSFLSSTQFHHLGTVHTEQQQYCTSAGRYLPLTLTDCTAQRLVKAKLLLCFSKTQSHEDVWGEWEYSLDGGELSALRSGRFIPREGIPLPFLQELGQVPLRLLQPSPASNIPTLRHVHSFILSSTELTPSLTNTLVKFLVTWFNPAPAYVTTILHTPCLFNDNFTLFLLI
jgi:hypothetical protein